MKDKKSDKIQQLSTNNFNLPKDKRPVLQLGTQSRILVIGPAPGNKAHQSSTPWNDASGDRLRTWLNVSQEEFYDAEKFALISMNFWYPGKNKYGNDNPPSLEHAELWHRPLLKLLPNIKLTLLIGHLAQIYMLGAKVKPTLTETVRTWREYLPQYIVMPHPSWHNNAWINRHLWFKQELLPALQIRVNEILRG